MKRLAIDTSTDRATLALEVDKDLYVAEQYGIKQHAASLLLMIQQLMNTANIAFDELDEIVFGCGPGSFTGLRVSCSVAKALAYAHNLPLCPVNSLQAMAMSINSNNADYTLILLDAKMHELYWAVFEKNILITPVAVSTAREIKIHLPGSLIVAGCGYNDYLSQLDPALQARIIGNYEIYPDASIMLKCTDKCERVSAEQAQPLYIRNNVTQGSKA